MIDNNQNVASNRIVDNTYTTSNSNAHKGELARHMIDEKYNVQSNETSDLSGLLMDKLRISKNRISIGSTTVTQNNCELFYREDISDLDGVMVELHSMTADRPSSVSAEFLSKIWNVDIGLAEKAIHQNTHLNRKDHENDLTRMFNTNDRMLRYKRIQSHFFTDTFFVTKKAKSSRGNTCAQIFVSDKGFVAIYLMKKRSDFYDALQLFCKEVGVPINLVVDPSGEQTSTKVKRFSNQVGMTLKVLEESTQWANRAELYVGLFKEAIRQDMRKSNSPIVFWDYCATRRSIIHNLTPKNLFQLRGETPIAATFGVQGDISKVAQFNWYDWCYFREQTDQFPFQKEQLGRVLGPAINEGNEMAQHILKQTGEIVPRRTLRRLKQSEIDNDVERLKRHEFNEKIKIKYGDSMTIPTPSDSIELEVDDFIIEPDGDDAEMTITMDDDPVDDEGELVFDQPFTEILIGTECVLPVGDGQRLAKVRKRSVDSDGNDIGVSDPNPFLNTAVYDVEFDDGTIRKYGANIIAQNIFEQVDDEGYSLTKLEGIIDYVKEDDAVPKSRSTFKTKSGQIRKRRSTKGWKLLVKYTDGTQQWVPLKILKETNPVEVAEFAEAMRISDEPAFNWWTPYVLRKRDVIISSLSHKLRKVTHKYGIEIPTTIEDAMRIDAENGNDHWSKAVSKEMGNVKVAFHILSDNDSIPDGYTKASGHLIFDVKMDFTRKARWVKDGHKTPDPVWSTYAGVVSRDSVRIALTYAALNNVDVMAADIQNAYLQAPASERHYIICGAEFGLENVGKVALIKRALYGGKSAGADFWRHLRTCMEFLGFQSTISDAEVWRRKAVKDNGHEYWEYILLYVDDALCISHRAEDVLRNELGKYFVLKQESISKPNIYLGNKVTNVTLENGVKAWALSSSQYVQSAV